MKKLDIKNNNKNIEEILILRKKVEDLTKENKSLKRLVAMLSSAQNNLEKSHQSYIKLQEDSENEILKREKEINNLKNKIEEIEEEKIKLVQEYRENIDSFTLNKNIIHQLELENKTFKEENNFLKLKQKSITDDCQKQIDQIKIIIKSKFNRFKNKIIDELKQNKGSLEQINFIHNDLSNNIISLQNSNLLVDLEVLQTEIENLRLKNQNLTKQNSALLSDIEINKQVQFKLAKKINDSEIIQTRKHLSKNTTKTDSNFFNDINLPTNRNSTYSNANHSKLNEKKIYNKNDFSAINFRKIKENRCPLINIITPEIKKNKFKDLIFGKDKKIGLIQQKYDNINNKFEFYMNKYQKLIDFLEDCLNNFFKDEKLRKNEKIQINIEKVKNLNFELFNQKEKYTILIVLMKYLLPIVTFNFKTKFPLDEKLLEKVAGLNISGKDFSNYVLKSDNNLRRTFFVKNNSSIFKKNLLLTDNNIMTFLKGRNGSLDLRLINQKYKVI